MTFNPPKSGSTRLAEDVWLLICEHAETNGNSSPREALEQLVRQSLPIDKVTTTVAYIPNTQQKEVRPQKPDTNGSDNSVASALDDVLLK